MAGGNGQNSPKAKKRKQQDKELAIRRLEEKKNRYNRENRR